MLQGSPCSVFVVSCRRRLPSWRIAIAIIPGLIEVGVIYKDHALNADQYLHKDSSSSGLQIWPMLRARISSTTGQRYEHILYQHV